MDRRDFLDKTPKAGIGLALTGSEIAKTLARVSATDNEMPDKEEVRYLSPESLAWPEEKYIPELIRNYMRGFNNWVDVSKQQKEMLMALLDNMAYKNSLLRSGKKYMTEKTESEVFLAVERFIEKRKEQLEEVPFKFDILEEDYGQYNKMTDRITLDSTTNFMQRDHKEKFEKYGTVSPNATTPGHEFWHAIRDKYRHTFVGEARTVLDAIKESKKARAYVSEEEIDKRIESLKYNDKGVVTSWRDESESDKGTRYTEIQSYLMQIRLILHIVHNTNPEFENIPNKFNMYESRTLTPFTKEHLEFLRKNEMGIFGVDYIDIEEEMPGKKEKVKKTIIWNFFRAMQMRFEDEILIKLMNTVY